MSMFHMKLETEVRHMWFYVAHGRFKHQCQKSAVSHALSHWFISIAKTVHVLVMYVHVHIHTTYTCMCTYIYVHICKHWDYNQKSCWNLLQIAGLMSGLWDWGDTKCVRLGFKLLLTCCSCLGSTTPAVAPGKVEDEATCVGWGHCWWSDFEAARWR